MYIYACMKTIVFWVLIAQYLKRFYLYFGISLTCRIGQKKDVRIYRLITRNTYEQHLFQCSSRKYGLDEAILGSMQEINHGSEYNENIENLLKKGAYSLLKV